MPKTHPPHAGNYRSSNGPCTRTAEQSGRSPHRTGLAVKPPAFCRRLASSRSLGGLFPSLVARHSSLVTHLEACNRCLPPRTATHKRASQRASRLTEARLPPHNYPSQELVRAITGSHTPLGSARQGLRHAGQPLDHHGSAHVTHRRLPTDTTPTDSRGVASPTCPCLHQASRPSRRRSSLCILSAGAPPISVLIHPEEQRRRMPAVHAHQMVTAHCRTLHARATQARNKQTKKRTLSDAKG